MIDIDIDFSKMQIPGIKLIRTKRGISRLQIHADGDYELKSVTFTMGENKRDQQSGR